MMKIKNKILLRTLSLLLILALISMFKINVNAASFSGSGTEKDPYIVTNAEQLNAIRNNLSAHYKLGNTIDLSSISNFVPIGNLDRPFTGSLTCDLGSDKMPKYAVKNLKVHVAKTAYISENKSKWEAGAFGVAKGASFTNIYLLNVNVANDNFGDNTGNVVYGDYKPGMDEQFSAALVGNAKDCTVTGCMSSGKIDTSSNNAGGLIGRAEGSNISNSYSIASVLSKGKWGTGGLIGTLEDTSLTYSFYKGGEVSCGSEYSSQGMLFATATSCIITDCYALGTGLGGQGNIGNFTKTSIANCYSAAKVNHAIPSEYIGSAVGNAVKNVYVCENGGAVSINIDLPKATPSQLKGYFQNLKGWNTGGEFPTLSDIIILTDENKYVPGAGENTNSGSGSQNESNGNSGSDTEEIVSEETSAEQLDRLKKIAESLPEASKLSEKNIDDILEAKSIIDNLPDDQYSKLDSEISAKIEESYKAIQPIMLTYLVKRLEKINVKKLKASDKQDVLRLEKIYNGLTDDTKEAFSDSLLAKLKEAVKKVNSFSDTQTSVSTQPMTTSEKIIVVLLSVIAVIVFAGNVYLSVLVFKKKKVLDSLLEKHKESSIEKSGGKV